MYYIFSIIFLASNYVLYFSKKIKMKGAFPMETIYGKRIFTKVNRPSRDLVEAFHGIPSSNINDMMNRMFCMNSTLKCLGKGNSIVGTAITVHCSEGDNTLLHRAMDLAQSGDIIVVNDGGCTTRSLCGEMMFNYAHGKGIVGFVIDGSIRDVDSLKNLDFAVYARGVTPQGPWKKGSGEINVPIACCGQVVCPGDILVGDADGIVVIKPDFAEDVLKEAKSKFSKEEKKLVDYHAGIFDTESHTASYIEAVKKNGMITFDEVCK